MNPSKTDSQANLSLDSLKRLDEVCAAFETAWQAGQKPRLEDYLGTTAEPERTVRLRELLKLEIELRSAVGQKATAAEYYSRFPNHGGVIAAQLAPEGATVATDTPSGQASATPASPSAGETASEGDSSHSDVLAFLQPPTKPGTMGRLGTYEIQGVVGRGGMGVVLKALDERLHRIVAIKVLGPQYATNASARKRFEREAKAAAAVSHDHIVPIYHVDEVGGVPFLVMPLIVGRSLQDRIDQSGPLELKQILRIGHQTACGLAAAHKQGIIHRDIKPANILLENGVERVKITDFGLARAVDDASVTQSGVITGTPMYMAPEQARGEQVDHRADLFSLGSVIYAMCTGHSPFRASGTHAVLMRVIEDDPRHIGESNPELPDWLNDIIGKLLAKKPAERFQTAKEVAELLEQHLAHVQQPHVAPKPARVAVAAPPAEKITREVIYEGTQEGKRAFNHFLILGGPAILVISAVMCFLVHVGAAFGILVGIVMFHSGGWVTYRWQGEYKGRRIRLQTSLNRGEALFIDDVRVATGPFGEGAELRGQIETGHSGDEEIIALCKVAFWSVGCQIFVEHRPRLASKPASVEIERGASRELILERTDGVTGWIQVGVVLGSLALGLAGVLLCFLNYGNIGAAVIGMVLCILALVGMSGLFLVKQRFQVAHRGHIIQCEKSLYLGETLYVDGRRADRKMVWGGAGKRQLLAVIAEGEGAGDTITAEVTTGQGQVDCKVFVEHRPRSAAAAARSRAAAKQHETIFEATESPMRIGQNLLLGAGVLLFVAGTLTAALNPNFWKIFGFMFSAGGMALGAAAILKQRWEMSHKGHSIRVENSAWGAELLIDDDQVASRGRGQRRELRGAITNGDGAGEIVLARLYSSFTEIRVEVFVEGTGVNSAKADDWITEESRPVRPVRSLGKRLAWTAVGYVLLLTMLGSLIAAYSNGGWWSTPGVEFFAAAMFLVLAVRHWIARPRWLAFVPLLLSVFVVALGFVLWPYSTARHFCRLMQAGRWGDASQLVDIKGQSLSLRDQELIVRTGDDNSIRLPVRMLPLVSNNSSFEHFMTKGTGDSFPFSVTAKFNQNTKGQAKAEPRCELYVSALQGTIRLGGANLYDPQWNRNMTTDEWNAWLDGKRVAPLVAKLPEAADEVLQAMVGTWRVEMTHKVVKGQPINVRLDGEADISWVAGKSFLRVREQLAPPGANFIQIFVFDPKTGDFRNLHFDATGTMMGPTTSRWDSRTHTLTGTSLPDPSGSFVKNTRFIDANTMEWEAIVRDKGGNTLFDTHTKMTRVAGPAKINEDEAPVPAPPEMAVAYKFLGDWQTEGTMKAPEPGPTKSTSKTSKVLGGRFIETRETMQPLQHSNYVITTWDVQQQAYRLWTMRHNGFFGEYRGAWDAQAQRLSWTRLEYDGTKGTMVVTWPDADHYESLISTRNPAGNPVLDVQSTTKRLPPAAAPAAKMPESAAEVLPALAGVWDFEFAFKVINGEPNDQSHKGQIVHELVAGQRFLRRRMQPTANPQVMNQLNVLGFDPATKEFTDWYFDAMGNTTGPIGPGRWNHSQRAVIWDGNVPNERGTMTTLCFENANTVTLQVVLRSKDRKGLEIHSHCRMTRAAGPANIREDTAPVPVPPQMGVLHRLVGNWDMKGTQRPTPDMPEPPPPTTTAVQNNKILGGRFVEESLEQTGATTNYQLYSYDPAAKQYRLWNFNSIYGSGQAKGTWDAKNDEIRWQGFDDPKTRTEFTWKWKGPNQRELTMQVWDNANKLLYDVTWMATRKKNDNPNAPENVLARYHGTWNVATESIPKRPEDAPSNGLSISEPVAGGKFLRNHTKRYDGKGERLSVQTYDEATRKFLLWEFHSNGKCQGPSEGTWDPATQTLSWRQKSEPHFIDNVHQHKLVDADTIQSHIFTKDPDIPGFPLLDVRQTYTRAKQTTAPKLLPIDPNRPAELTRLDKMLGRWRNDLMVKTLDEPQGKPGASEYHARWILGGRFLEAHETDLQTDNMDYWLVGLSDGAKDQQYRFWHFSGLGGYTVIDGTWDEAKQTLAWKAKDGSVAGRWIFLPDGNREAPFKVFDPQGKLLVDIEGKALKVTSNVLRSFGPDTPLLNIDSVTPDLGGWRIESKGPGTLRLFEVQYPGVDDCVVMMKAKLKTQKMEVGASLEMWARIVDQESWSKGEGEHQVAGTTNWSEYQIPFVFRKGELANRIQLGLRLGGKGTVWIKDVELLRQQLPLGFNAFNKPPLSDRDKMRGVWKAVMFAGRGDKKIYDLPKNLTWSAYFEDTKATFHKVINDPNSGKLLDETRYQGIYTLDTTTEPHRLTSFTPTDRSGNFLGIYRWEEERLVVRCYFNPSVDQAYPKDFEPGTEPNAIILVLEKQP